MTDTNSNNADDTLVTDTIGLFATVSALTKGLEIAKAIKSAHGTFFRFDTDLIGKGLTSNIKCHVKYGAIAAAVFYVGNRLFPQQRSFVERVESERASNTGPRTL